MARGGRGGSQQPPRRLVDLTGVISLAEKNDLITLVNAITEKMHNDISAIFDSPPVTPLKTEHGHIHWLSLPLLHRRDKKSQVTHEILGDDSKAYNKTHNIIEKEEAEAMTPQLRELKKEALTFFSKWQTIALLRIRDINVIELSENDGQMRGRGRGGRGAPRGRGGRGGRACRGTLTLAIGMDIRSTHDSKECPDG